MGNCSAAVFADNADVPEVITDGHILKLLLRRNRKMSKTTEVFNLRLVFVILGFMAINQMSCAAKDSCAAPSKIVVSRVVKNAAGKSYIEVDGKPFLYNSVQSWHTHEAHCSNQPRNFGDANCMCFTFWLYWSHLEPKEGQYDWSELDKIIDLANEYDVRLDIVWAGTNFCDHLDPRFAPDWVLNNHDQYHLKDPNGNCILVDGGDMGNCCAINPANSTILQKEKKVISDMLRHLKKYDKNHRVIAIQVENEINIHKFMGGKSNVLAYVNALGRVVKQSNYEIVTRANIYAFQMDSDLNALEYIDGHGLDPYKKSVSLIRNIINSDVNTKLRYIAENAAWPNSTSQIVAALANGGFYNIYRLDYDSVWNKPGVYDKNFEPWSVTTKVTNLNSALNKAGALIAAAPKAEMLEFNTETDYPSASYQVVKSLSGRAIGFKSRNGSEPVGLVVEKDGQYYCMADNIAYFTFDVKPVVFLRHGSQYARDTLVCPSMVNIAVFV